MRALQSHTEHRRTNVHLDQKRACLRAYDQSRRHRHDPNGRPGKVSRFPSLAHRLISPQIERPPSLWPTTTFQGVCWKASREELDQIWLAQTNGSWPRLSLLAKRVQLIHAHRGFRSKHSLPERSTEEWREIALSDLLLEGYQGRLSFARLSSFQLQ